MKKRKIKNISLREISLVDKPANERPFLLFKRDGNAQDDSFSKAKKKINIEIESDGTAGGTAITINGDKVDKPKSFNFSFWSASDPKSPVDCSYSRLVESEGGFQRTETYYLAKSGDIMNPKIKELLVKFLGDKFKKADFEQDELNDETIIEITKALTTINEYKEEFPADLSAAVGLLAIHASQGYKTVVKQEDLEKAGAKLSKDTLTKIKSIVAAAKALESILPKEASDDDNDKKKKSADNDSELQKTIETLTKSVTEMAAKMDKKETSDQLTKVSEALAEVSKRLNKVEGKPVGTRKGIQEADNDDNVPVAKGAGKDGEVLWPSLAGGDSEE